MDSEKSWSAYFCSTADRDYDFADILYNGKNVATIKKVDKELVINWLKSENDYYVPIDWLVDLLKNAKDTLS